MDKAATTTTTTTSSLDQTHDFMNVDSFSQLPFIRPAPTNSTKPSSSSSAAGIRLFGIDFSSSSNTATDNSDSGDSNNLESSKDTNNNNNRENNNNNNMSISSTESGRKFECHYCCRNFPTSQALGGHQNAHKRERQHAKRAHLQSAMMSADPNNHHHHFYNNYSHPHLRTNTSNNSYYPTSLSTTPSYSYHQSHQHQHPPTINGSPLAVWRIPSSVHSHSSLLHQHHNFANGIHRDRSLHPLPPLLAGSHSPAFTNIDTTSASKGSSSINNKNNMSINMSMNKSLSMSSSHQSQVRRSSSDQVSLDLHL